MKADEILDKAAVKIASGWCRGAYERDGKLCSMGAIFWAALNVANPYISYGPWYDYHVAHPEIARAFDALADVMKQQFDEACMSNAYSAAAVLVINDDYVSDAAEVVACMEKAAANLRGTIGA